MRMATGAKAGIVLGATLIAVIPFSSALAGIHGSSVEGIHGSSVEGIHGSSVDGIHGSSVDGIHGSSVDGIHGSSVDGIHGSSVDGIHGSSVDGIHGRSVDGIHGSSVDGIHGSSVDGIHGSSVEGIHGSSVDGIHGSSTAILFGPIERIMVERSVVESLGQSILVSTEMLNQLSVGDLVSVEGSIVGPGLLYADSVTVSSEQYVAGATEVFVTGILSSIDASTGTATLGTLRVDYTSSLASGRTSAGVVWSFRGTQPSSQGVMLSDRVHAY